MKRFLFSQIFLFHSVFAAAQVDREFFDPHLNPAKKNIRYSAVTEKRDSLWYREITYLPEQSIALQGWYRDRECFIPHGIVTLYYPNKLLQQTGAYRDGKKEGTWLHYSPEGNLVDSLNYAGDRLKGISLKWLPDGSMTDSLHFDGMGNGVRVSWHPGGPVREAGHLVSENVKTGRWNYFHPNGQLQAREEYKDGVLHAVSCFDSAGKEFPPEECASSEASFPGGDAGWRRFLEKNINGNVASQNGAPGGSFTVIVQFIVDRDGAVSDVQALTHQGYGMEAEVLRMIRRTPKWNPARYFGEPVKAYRKQQVTFVVPHPPVRYPTQSAGNFD